MELVLLSGGSGKRLWPLSNDSRSKQFLKILDSKSGELESMVQRVWRQLASAGLEKSSTVTTSKAQVEIIHSQLGSDIPLIIEPERRDTFPAIALAATYLYHKKAVSLDEIVIVLPVDTYVEDAFFLKIKRIAEIVRNSNADITLLGVTPTYPSEKYGYIVPEVACLHDDYMEISHFKEKPNVEEAQKLIGNNALWNCGIFAFKLEYILGLLTDNGLPTQYDELLRDYNKLPQISFDYEVVEKAKRIVATAYDGYWKDLGTWNTLTEEMATQMIGKTLISNDSHNNHLINELDVPLIVNGLSNTVVVASPDGILVSDKKASPQIKDLVKHLDQRPMYVERRWGWYRVLDFTKFNGGNEVLTKRVVVQEGKNLSYHYHDKRNEIWTIVNGEGVFIFNDVMKLVRTGDVLQIPAGSKHAIKANTELEFVEIQSGDELVDEDIKRICLSWDEIMKTCLTSKNT